MSIQLNNINVSPPEAYQKREYMRFKGYECPLCKGFGWVVKRTGHNQIEQEKCSYCEGAGMVQALIEIKWTADFVSTI